jgi:hypothetical protein
MPRLLYYFTPIDSDERRAWLRKLLVDHEIWFRDPRRLNDINELKPRLVFAGTDKQVFAYARTMVRTVPNLSPAERLVEAKRYARSLRANPRQHESGWHDMLARVGVLSLSASADDPLLWAHYAGAHSGVCIAIDADIGLFGMAKRVHYADVLPTINRVTDSVEEMVIKALYTKSKHWSHENEWRVIARWRDEDRIARHMRLHAIREDRHSFFLAQNGPGYYKFPQKALVQIILGWRVSRDDEAWLDSVVRQSNLPIVVNRIRRRYDGALEIG